VTVHAGVLQPAPEPCQVAEGRAAIGRKLKIVMVQTQADGVQELSRILGNGLRAAGYDVHHAFLFRRSPAFDRHPNVFFCAPNRPRTVAGMIRMLVVLHRYLKASNADVVICFQHYGNIVGTLAACLAGKRRIIANRVSARKAVPTWAWQLEHLLGLAGLFTSIVVNSEIMQRDYRRYPRWFRARVVRIEHGFEPKITDLSKEDARKRLGLPLQATLLGCVARLHAAKNPAAAVQLLGIEPSWHLALAGHGPERSNLAIMARSLGVSDRLHFVGELSPAQVAAFLKALDVFVFPSLAETFGLAVAEAAQAGVPVVANELAVLRDVLAVEGEPCALLVDVNDANAFAQAVRRLLNDAEFRETLSTRAARLAHRFSLQAMTGRYTVLIENVVR
jgi:L-malate glycosyltransferase